MKIDFSADAADLRAMLDKAVQKYAKKHATPASAAQHPPVTRIDLTFWLGDGGPVAPFVTLQLDTRPGSEPDGIWTHGQFATLKRPGWRSPINAACDGKPVTATLLTGKPRKLSGDNVTKIVGDFCVAVMKAAKVGGAWAALPKSARCEMGVEELGGSFGWPAYDKRGRGNVA